MIKVIFLTHHPVQDASSRYRIYQFIPLLEQRDFVCKVRPFSTQRLFEMLRNGGSPLEKAAHALYCSIRRAVDLLQLHKYDLVIIHREVYPFFAPHVERIAFRLHKKIVFDLDDAVYEGHDRKAQHYSLLYRFKYGNGLNEVFTKSALVIAGSSALAEHVRSFHCEVEIIPTVVDLDRYPFAMPQESAERTITIGWYGSNSTSPYLQKILPALKRIEETYRGRVRFRFFGDTKLILDLCELQILPFKLETEIEDLRSIDVGLMPLPDTVWTRAKCAFKAIQYMALGIPTVVSPIGMAAEVVRHNETGLHATTEEEWYEQISRLIDDIDLQQRLAIAGRAEVERCYSLQRWGAPFVEALLRVHATPLPVEIPAGDAEDSVIRSS
jgi:glycosyltransferase involved in cell wall biosynthesis